MMKKFVSAFILIGVFFMLMGCENTSPDNRTLNSQTTVDDILQSGIAKSEGDASQNGINTVSNNTENASKNTVSFDEIDVDLTVLSSTMVYSEVYNMMSMPENYIGKTVKMNGIFSSYYDDTTGKDYYACIIKDATACCAQGIEFILADGSEYPKEGEIISVVGVFDTYNEGQFRYSTLREAIIV